MADKERLEDCWEIMRCGQGVSDEDDESRSICPAKLRGMGHSCWVVEGVLGGDSFLSVQVNSRPESCITCKVFRRYNRVNGTDKDAIPEQCPFEEKKYQDLLLNKRILRYMRRSQGTFSGKPSRTKGSHRKG